MLTLQERFVVAFCAVIVILGMCFGRGDAARAPATTEAYFPIVLVTDDTYGLPEQPRVTGTCPVCATTSTKRPLVDVSGPQDFTLPGATHAYVVVCDNCGVCFCVRAEGT